MGRVQGLVKSTETRRKNGVSQFDSTAAAKALAYEIANLVISEYVDSDSKYERRLVTSLRHISEQSKANDQQLISKKPVIPIFRGRL